MRLTAMRRDCLHDIARKSLVRHFATSPVPKGSGLGRRSDTTGRLSPTPVLRRHNGLGRHAGRQVLKGAKERTGGRSDVDGNLDDTDGSADGDLPPRHIQP